MSVRGSPQPDSALSGRPVQVTSQETSVVTSDVGHHAESTFSPSDYGSALSRSMPTSFSFPGSSDGGSGFGRSVPRDDSGLSIVSLGRGRPSDSGYGTDSPASLNTTGALRFRYGSVEGSIDDVGMSPPGGSRVEVQVEPEEFDFDLGLNEDDEYGDDDVFLDVVPEEEVDGEVDDIRIEPVLLRHPSLTLRRDVVDGVWGRSQGGSDGQTDTSTEEDEDDTPSSSSSNPITIPRPLRTEALEYAVALAYTPPGSASGGLPAGSSSGAILLARGSLRQEGALWSLTHAHLTRGPNALAVRRQALLASTPLRNGLQRLQLENEPYRRYSDGVDPRIRTTPSPHRPGGSSAAPRSAPPAPGRRCQSESAAHLEQQFGQELRRISDEFHLSYQSGARALVRRNRDISPAPQASSLPEARRRGSLVDRFIGFFSTSPSTPTMSSDVTHHDADETEVFTPRRRAHSEILMASGVTAAMFGRQESLMSSTSRSSAEDSPERRTSIGEEYFDEVDNAPHSGSYDGDDDDHHHAIFHLSTEQ